jgi:two-component system response regulator HydG
MATAPDPRRILVVDDSPETIEVLRRTLEAEGYRVFTAAGAEEASRLIEVERMDLVVTDLKMPRVSGLDLVRYIRENLKGTEVMMITGYPSVKGAVEAVKTGAEEYLSKPFTAEELLGAVRRSLDTLAARQAGQPEGGVRSGIAVGGLLGDSEAMREVLRAVSKSAATAATILITGESGTGKELVARAIHYQSPRAPAPFVPVNCGAIPEGLLESELFGHLKGAFTGATESRAGLFHAADGGTIFLDEVSEMSPAMQVKLLRALEDREIWMVGSSRPRKLDVRIVAATNIELEGLVKAGAFREDLFYRLNVITIHVPPLRGRGDDILLLAQHFASKFANELRRSIPRFSDDVLRILRRHDWPGNVRELENVVQRLVVMTEGDRIEAPDLPSVMRFAAPRDAGVERTLADVESEHIANVLASVRGNKTRAAEILGIDRKTLREKLKTLPKPSR